MTNKSNMLKVSSHLEIQLVGAGWKKEKGLEKRLQAAVNLTLASLPAALLPIARQAQVTLLLTNDKAVQTLNHDYRGKDKPTNVLSFPQFEKDDLVKLSRSKTPILGGVHVGDIAVAYQYVVKEAKAEHKVLADHVTHLLIHGLLHLFGYDHDTVARAAKMEKLEKEIMATLGLPDPYAVWDEDDKKPCRSTKQKR